MKTQCVSAAIVGVGLFLFSSSAFAQQMAVDPPPFVTSSAAKNDWSDPGRKKDRQITDNMRHLGIGLTTSAFIVPWRWEIANGGIVAVDVVWRRVLQPRTRLEVGALGRFAFTRDAVLLGAGIPARLVMGINEIVETDLAIELSYTRLMFALPFFAPRNGFIASMRWEIGFLLDPKISVGVTPIGMSVVAGERVDAFVTYEPGIWARFSPI